MLNSTIQLNTVYLQCIKDFKPMLEYQEVKDNCSIILPHHIKLEYKDSQHTAVGKDFIIGQDHVFGSDYWEIWNMDYHYICRVRTRGELAEALKVLSI